MVAEDTPAADSDEPRPARGSSRDGGSSPCITAVRCSPDRTVFTEDDNFGGWISTDTTVDVRR